MDHARGLAKNIELANFISTISSPITVLASPKVPARRAPGLGEHNDEVLAEAGFSRTEIDGFRSAGVIPPTAPPSEGRTHDPGN
jgi:crotonobetainyl-CoA:carnitine CoA-transferase CaiB-like acyl-CoA transferase